MARSQVITDNFNRASLGGNWQQLNPTFGNITINASTVVWGPNSFAVENAQAARWIGAGSVTNDQYAAIKYVTVGGIGAADYGVGVICRASTDTDGNRDFYYFIVLDNGTAELGKVVNGTKTALHGPTAVSWASGDVVALEVEGTTLRACKGTTALGGSWTQTDSALSSGGVGVLGIGAIAGDDFDAGDIAAAPAGPAEGSTRGQHKKQRRPGRGPYSKGAYRRPSIDVLPQTFWTVDSDAVAPTDSASTNAAFNSDATDSVAASDSAVSESTGNNSIASDAVSAADSASATGVFVRDATDSIAINDAAVSTQGTPIVSDRTGTARPRPGRTPYSVGKLFRPRIDVYTNTFNQTAAESAAAADTASTTIVGVASASDAVSIADSASTQIVVAAAASDAVSINDSAIGTAAGDRDAADAINIDDSATAIIVGSAFVIEALALADSADSSLFSGNNLVALEAFAASDSADTAGSVHNAAAAESQLLADLASAVKIGAFEPGSNSRSRVDKKPRVTKGRIAGRRI
jgi:hypothetical protein